LGEWWSGQSADLLVKYPVSFGCSLSQLTFRRTAAKYPFELGAALVQAPIVTNRCSGTSAWSACVNARFVFMWLSC
jgi:hypothetical protein